MNQESQQITAIEICRELIAREIGNENADELINDLLMSYNRIALELQPSMASIKQVVCEHYNVPISAMSSSQRSQPFALARMVAMHIARKLTGQSLPAIGKAFGGKDHTTVMHAVKSIQKRRRAEPDLDASVRLLINNITNCARQEAGLAEIDTLDDNMRLLSISKAVEAHYMQGVSFEDNVDTIAIGGLPSRDHTGIDITRG